MKLQIYVLSLIFVILLSSLAFAEGERVDAKCEIGINDKIKLHSWHNLYVTLQNYYPQRKDVLVTVERKMPDQPKLVLKQIVSLDGGDSEVKIKLEFLCPPVKFERGIIYEIFVRDRNSNFTLLKYYEKYYRKVKRNNKEMWIGKWFEKDMIERSVTVLGENDEHIIAINANKQLKMIRTFLDNTDFGKKNYIIANREMEDLPTNWLMLSGIKLIIMNNPESKKLQYGGRDKALEDWIRAGGTLVLMLSEKIEEYKSLSLTKLAGVNLKSMKIVNRIGHTRRSSFGYNRSNSSLDGKYQCIEAEVENSDTLFTEFWAYNGDDPSDPMKICPAVVNRWVDSGKIVTVLFDIAGTTNTLVSQYLYDKVVIPVFLELKKNEIPANPEKDDDNEDWNSYDSDFNTIDLQQNIGNLINDIQQAKPIKFGTIALFIGIYMFVVAFVDFLLLKIMSLLHWTWLSVIIWVVAFSIIADRIGETFRGGEMSSRELIVVDSGLSCENSTYHQYSGIFSQQNQSYTVYHDSDKAGITRLERLVGTDFYDDSDSYYRSYETQQVPKNRSYDEKTDYEIAQPSDVDDLKHPGAYLKSVILPRWVIRDLQAKSIIKNKKKQGLNIEFVKKVGYYDLNNNVYSNSAFEDDTSRYPIYVTPITVRNDYPYPLNGICIVYSGGKVATYSGVINPKESVEFYYNGRQDILFAERSDELAEGINSLNYADDSSSSLDITEMFEGNLGGYSSSNFKVLLRKNVEFFKIFPNTRNQMNIPREALMTLIASSCKLLMKNYERESIADEDAELYIQTKAYNNLDISHRIVSGETIAFCWSDWHICESSNGKDFENKLKTSRYLRKSSKLSSYELYKMPIFCYDFPSMHFENWNVQTSRFVVTRTFTQSLRDMFDGIW